MNESREWSIVEVDPTLRGAWRDELVRRLAEHRCEINGGRVDEAHAQAELVASRAITSDGPSPDTFLVEILDGARVVATAWLGTYGVPPATNAIVNDVAWVGDTDNSALGPRLREGFEAWARERGAAQLQVRTLSGSAAARDLTSSGNWSLVATRMLRCVGQPSVPPARRLVSLDAMTHDEYAAFEEHLIVSYGEDMARAGAVAHDEAIERSREQMAALLPDGVTTINHHFFVARHENERVGILWLFMEEVGGLRRGYVYDVEMEEAHRGEGFGRAVMMAGEEFLKEQGATLIELNVFGFNDVARTLYLSLGYVVADEMFSTLV